MRSVDSGHGRRLSVLSLSSTYPRWQADTDPGFVHELNRRLVARGIDVTVLAPRAPGVVERETLDGVEVVRFAYWLRRGEQLAYDGGILPKIRSHPALAVLVPAFLAGLYTATRRLTRTRQFDCIHAHWVLPQGMVAAFAAAGSVPVLCTLHGADLFALRSWGLRHARNASLRRCDGIAVVSDYMRRVVVADSGVEVDRVEVSPMGADLDRLFVPAPDVQRENHLLAFAGRLVAKKGVGCLLDAFVRIREVLPDARLEIAGDGPLRGELRRKVDSLGISDAVTFHGSLPPQDLASLFRRATVAVVPSIVDSTGDQEGLGLVTIEAMGCACPVIASDLPAIRDVVDDDTGVLVPPNDPRHLAEAAAALLVDDARRNRLARAARLRVVERFDWERVADRYADRLRSLVACREVAGR